MSRDPMPRDVAELVRWRDRDRCRRCDQYTPGGSLHHRQGRRPDADGRAPHRAANLILLCGSGTTGCHGWVHAHPAAAYEAGLMVRRLGRAVCEDTPLDTPHGPVLLNADGTTTRLPKERA